MKYDGKTTEELQVLRLAIEADPANKTNGGLYRYTPQARKRLDAIYRQITHNMAMKRAAEGRSVVADGYSGRQSKRRW